MSTKEILNNLSGYTEIKNENLSAIALQVKTLTEDYQNNVLSAGEYTELLRDVEISQVIVEGAAELNAQKELNMIINTAITIAATAAKAI